ncbi:MAG: UDP-N-acetylmuramate dehydrogenase [Pseudomonadota bacterium]|nr:UDP-N-acetylmuramate dehydrogenase [Pseudomonadota bacterium]
MNVLHEEPLARHGYWRVGGPMERLVFVGDTAELAAVLAEAPGAHVLGNGSNLLIPDAGLRGTVVKLGGVLRESRMLPDAGDSARIHAGAGLLNAVLLARTAKLGFGGLGPLAGVPGTVGGAVAMNAGTALGEVADILEAVEGIGPEGPRTIPRAELPMRYREGGLPPGFIVTAAVFRVSRAGFAEEQVRMTTHLARRKATQPLDLPSCGSVFRNPPGDHAGRLIELVGLKGHREGGAEISERHANFIVNLGGASAANVMACVRIAWERVRAETGVALVPEVHVLGEWPGGVWPLG